jgi:hypothetical protein
VQAYRWKSLSSLDGSQRTFRERVRAPDANFPYLLKTLAVFLPIVFALLMLPIVILPLLTEAVLGPKSWITTWLYALSSYALQFIAYAVLLTCLGMFGLRGYVALKLRQQKKAVQ